MKMRHLLLNLSLFFLSGNLFGQTNQAGKLIFPFLDSESQSNIAITVSDVFGSGQPCPAAYTNALSNKNLFTLEEQKLIETALATYTKITTNSGPIGTELISLYKTNIINNINGTVRSEQLVGRYQYTNSDAVEEIVFGSGTLFVRHLNKSNDGYNVHIGRLGSGSSFRFMEVKQGLLNGVLVDFRDNHPQGMNWDYHLANFSSNHLVEYRQYTNGMVLGNFYLWNKFGNLLFQANFKEPYDFEKHRMQPQMH